MNIFRKKDKKGFTLAEVLICIVSLGIIGALSVPVINTSSKEKELRAARKKATSIAMDAWDYAKFQLAGTEELDGDKVCEEFGKFFQNGSGCNFTDRNGFTWSQNENAISVDVNGTKGPGELGKDIINFCIDESSNISVCKKES